MHESEQFFVGNIEDLTINNNAYRKVLYTTKTQQLVIMSLLPKEEIGEEIHKDVTQFIRVEQGECEAILDDQLFKMKDGDCVVVAPGTKHNIVNTSNINKLKLYTIYCPPEHPDNTLELMKPKSQIESVYNNIKNDYLSLQK